MVSANGTFITNVKIKEQALRPGDVIRIGETELRLDVAPDPVRECVKRPPPKAPWIIPSRPIYATTLTVLFIGLIASFIHFGLEAAREHWGIARSLEQWLGSSMYETNLARRDQEPSPVPSPAPKGVVAAERSPEELPPEIGERPVGNALMELSLRAIASLREDVAAALAAGDVAKAEEAIAAHKASPFRLFNAMEALELEKSVADVKHAQAKRERERLAAIEQRFGGISAKVQELLAAEKFDHAKGVLETLLTDKELGEKAKALLAEVGRQKKEYLEVALPRRRDGYVQLMLSLRPHLKKRNYAFAIAQLESLKSNKEYALLRREIDRERELLAVAAGKDVDPLAKSLRLFYAGDFHGFMEEIANVSERDLSYIQRLTLLGNVELVANASFRQECDDALALAGKETAAALQRLREIQQLYSDFPLDAAQTERLASAVREMEESLLKKDVDPLIGRHIALLRDPSSGTEAKIRALSSLKILNEPKARHAIEEMISDKSAVVRLKAGEALIEYQDPRATFTAMKLLDDPVYEVGARIARVIALRADEKVVGELKRQLTSKDPAERRVAAVGLGVLDPKTSKVISDLTRALQDESTGVRRAAAMALIRLGDAVNAVSALTGRLKVEEDEGVQSALIAALAHYKATSSADEMLSVIQREKGSLYRPDWIRALGETGNGDVARKLLPLLRDKNVWIRQSVLGALLESGAKVSSKDIRPFLIDDSAMNRSNALRILGRIGETRDLNVIIDALNDNEAVVRAGASLALTEWKKIDVIPAMISAADGAGGAELLAILKARTGQKLSTADEFRAWWMKNGANFR